MAKLARPPLQTNSNASGQMMVSSKPSSNFDNLVEFIRGPFCWRIVTFIVLTSLFFIARQENQMAIHVSEDDHKLFQTRQFTHNTNNPLYRCFDADDPLEWKPTTACTCTDPMIPSKRPLSAWNDHHQRLEKEAFLSTQKKDLDLVMLGDSIIEFLNGTKSMGTVAYPEMRRLFETFFTKAGGGTIEAVALGSSGDTSNNILWHLQNGLLPSRLQPKAWMIMVGTNDLGRLDCSKRNVLAGILHVAQVIHERKPGVPIIISALMPRSDKYEGAPASDYSLGKRWTQILWINRELKKFCALHPEWIFFDANQIFLQKVEIEGHDAQGAVEINPAMMEDALHPSVQGYEAWAEGIVEIFQKPPFQKKDSTVSNNL